VADSRHAVKLFSWSIEGNKLITTSSAKSLRRFFVMIRKSVWPKLSRDRLISEKRRPVRPFCLVGTIHIICSLNKVLFLFTFYLHMYDFLSRKSLIWWLSRARKRTENYQSHRVMKRRGFLDKELKKENIGTGPREGVNMIWRSNPIRVMSSVAPGGNKRRSTTWEFLVREEVKLELLRGSAPPSGQTYSRSKLK